MADAGTIARAFVQIVPTMKGVQSTLEQGFNGDAVGKKVGTSIAGKIKSMILKAGIATALGSAIKSAFEEGAKLQQSYKGGLDTLYGEAADNVRNYAKEAHKYGISMNDYSEQAVSFGAALKSAYGGDVTKAMEAANMAIGDMADNSAKMGTDISSIQDAYQGFAKSNYTMLDNLKLGYGGTKEEMARLLEDAQKLTGIHYDINNLGDVYNAIHAIQQNLGLTGVAAEEAKGTFSGSFAAMKASAANFLGSLTLGEDVKPALHDLIETSTTFLVDNLIPMAQTLGNSLVTAFGELKPYIDQGIKKIPPWLEEHIPEFLALGGEIIDALISGLTGQDSTIGASLASTLTDAFKTLSDILKDLLKAWNGLSPGMQEFILKAVLVSVAVGPMVKKIKDVWKTVKDVKEKFTTFKTTFVDNIGQIKSVGANLLGGIQKLWGVLMANPIILIVAAIAALVVGFIYLWNKSEAFRNFWIGLWNGIKDVVKTVVDGVVGFWNDCMSGLSSIGEAMMNAWNSVVSFLSTVWETIKNIITLGIMMIGAILSAAFQIITLPFAFIWENCKGIIMAAWDFIKSIVMTYINAVSTVIKIAWSLVAKIFSTVWDGIVTVFTTVWDTISSVVSTVINAIKDTITSIWDVIKDYISSVLDVIKGVIGSIWDAIKTKVSDVLNGIRDTIQSIWDRITEIVSGVIDGIKTKVTDGFNKVRDVVSDIFGAIKDKIKNIWDGAVDIVSGAIDRIKSFFNFNWSLPKIKLPHFSITGKFSLSPPEIPHLSVEWYAKAMDHAMVLNNATIFGAANGKLLGGGEAGAEVIAGEAHLMDMIRRAVNDGYNQSQEYVINVTVNPSQGMDEKELADRVIDKLSMIINRKGAPKK